MLIARAWEIRDGMLDQPRRRARARGAPTLALLIVASVATIVIAGIHAARIYRASATRSTSS